MEGEINDIDFTNEWINKIEILRQWLIKQL